MPLPTLTRRRGALAAGLLALALGTTALTTLPHPGIAQNADSAVVLPRPAGPDFGDLVARVAPGVVRVTVTGAPRAAAEIPPELRGTPFEQHFRRFGAPQQPRRMGQGSGFVVDPAGYIVTNNHVIGNAERVQVELADGRELEAKVVGADPQTDIALLKVEAGQPLTAVRFGDSDALRVGEWVVAMGNPYGLGGSATAGIVSARGRQIGAGPYDDFIQTDAPINPGNSGGPLFSTRGEVVGVNTAIFSPSGGNIGIGFAVPAKLAQQVVQQLREHGTVERGWLGVSMQPMDAEMAQALGLGERKGVLVAGVEANSPAARGGLQAGDVITGFAGTTVEQPRDLAGAVAAAKPGTTQRVAVIRNGESREQQVELGTHPATRQASQGERQPQGEARLGLALAPRQGGGATVARVMPGSVAEQRGIQPGDVILRAGDREVKRPQDVTEAVAAARQAGRGAIALQVEKAQGGRGFVAMPVG